MSATAPRGAELNTGKRTRLREHDRESFWHLISPHQQTIYKAAWSLSDYEELVEDLAQAAVLKTWRDFQGSSEPMSIRRHLVEQVIATNRKHQQKKEVLGLNAPSPIEPWRAVPNAGMAEFRADLHRALCSLPSQWREVYVLRDILGFSSSECAEILQLDLGEFKQLLSEARRQVYDEFAAYATNTKADSAGGRQ